ncbi:flagellar biosynthesis protein FlhA [Phycisphaera mikurensis]|uniref:Flagellar biosynthesis protein FlhA n=1 Tax=Phycisphaera mikurensis (strain NBRC 102666 / KCTC 22515 / FYK2301M01) TaxID=1142394 RepID=I0IGQ5_PHYMF|nr:flagellar biosynthesis protein FlhA [Phycisphaera mikurensis]MBB6443233.1 flagellar biosynthesis protein FlhA [Phycisphaera mikurensis]BAM04443.1 flagellar biosynthesis protein FlhA [Phycisphaera mikurensis NBRC 102666]
MQPGLQNLVNRVEPYRALLVPAAFIGLIAVIVVPLPPLVMDLLIAANLGLAALILMTTVFLKSPLEFSVFPSVLLATTLFRLVLNIATTRLILSGSAQGGDPTAVAGRVIEAFSEFVTGSSVVVGVILFLILIVVQFMVITKGAGRISEVAARFTLDGMPGKQMAIDADLNAGLIDEKAARERREKIGREADFYGAMDGAGKFVRGDAVAGIIITLVNIVGGFAVGVAINGYAVVEAAEVYTRLTVGDGLVSQMPALVISIAAALIVTRSGSKEQLGSELGKQLTGGRGALAMTAGFLGLLAFTGLPAVPLLSLATVAGVMAWRAGASATPGRAGGPAGRPGVPGGAAVAGGGAEPLSAEDKKKQEDDLLADALGVDTLELEIGYALVTLVDPSQGGDLLDRITLIRRQLAAENGLVMPPVRIRDNMEAQPNTYRLKVRGNPVAEGQLYPGQFMAMDGGVTDPEAAPLDGLRTREPAFGLEATWVDRSQREAAEMAGYTVIDPTSVLSTHLTEVVKNHAAELLDFEETANLVTQLREKSPALCDAVLGPASGPNESPVLKPAELQRVLQNLLAERVSIRDLGTVVETLGTWAPRTQDVDVLTEYVRNALRRSICAAWAVPVEAGPDGVGGGLRLHCVSVDPALEELISGYVDRGEHGTALSMPPGVANGVAAALVDELQRLMALGHHPVVLASPPVRKPIRTILEPHLPAAAVLGYNEVAQGVEVESVGVVEFTPQGAGTTPGASFAPGRAAALAG